MEEVTLAMLRRIMLGYQVEKDAFALPASGATTSMYTVTGGRIMLVQFFLEVTTVFSAAAETLRLAHTPNSGTLSNLSAASASIANKAVGTILSVTGLETDALFLGTGEGGASGMLRPQILRPGTLGLVGAAASNTGAVKAYAGYVPLDDGASLVAA